MKKLTKTEIAAAPQFIAMIDYKAATDKGLEYIDLTASDVYEAIFEVEKLFAENEESFYLVEVMEKNMEVAEEVISRGCHSSLGREVYYESRMKTRNGLSWNPVRKEDKDIVSKIVDGNITGLCIGSWARH